MEGKDVSIKRYTGPVPCEQVECLDSGVLVCKANEPDKVFSRGEVVVRELRNPSRLNPGKTIKKVING